jgi:hypothetical protein
VRSKLAAELRKQRLSPVSTAAMTMTVLCIKKDQNQEGSVGRRHSREAPG